MNSMPELVQAALSALRLLQPANRVTAIAILGMWAHVADIDVERVVDYYFTGGRPDARLAGNGDYRDGYATGFVEAVQLKTETAEFITVAGGRRVFTCCGKIDHEPHRNFCEHYRASRADRLIDDRVARWNREHLKWRGDVLGCPEWCTTSHTVDEFEDQQLISHLGADYADGTVRKLLDAHALSVQVARTDDLSEGTTGTPNLYVRCELELTSWEQAAELARTILDGFGYLKDA